VGAARSDLVRTFPSMNPDSAPRTLSVIVGSLDAAGTMRECLSALQGACEGIDAEILIADASADDSARLARESLPSARVLSFPVGTLVPALWGAGLAEARGRVVAFTIAQCVVERGWARALLEGIGEGAAGVGGRLDVRRDASATGRATFYLRYSAWLSATSGPAHEIAGDNAAYEREALLSVREASGAPFWEVEAHARLRAAGRTLVIHPGATAWFRDDTALRTMAARRFSHGRHSGSFRVKSGIRTRWQVVLGAPLVPLVLLVRVGRRVAVAPGHMTGFVSSLGAFFVLASAWAAGEAIGGFTAGAEMAETLRAA
jgi:Glycosyl transferase family 2